MTSPRVLNFMDLPLLTLASVAHAGLASRDGDAKKLLERHVGSGRTRTVLGSSATVDRARQLTERELHVRPGEAIGNPWEKTGRLLPTVRPGQMARQTAMVLGRWL